MDEAQVNEKIDNKEIIQNQEITKQENSEEINWRKFRQEREEARKRQEALEKRAQEKAAEAEALKAALESLLNNSKTKEVSKDNQEIDDIEKLVEIKLQQKEREYEQKRAEREAQEMPSKLKSVYNDFDEVCTQENIEYLEFKHPEIALPYKYMPDSFDKWASIYKAVKKHVPSTNTKKEQIKLEKNLSKPQSNPSMGSASGGDSNAYILSEDRKRSNWERMQKTIMGY